jgi:hypothetical protein
MQILHGRGERQADRLQRVEGAAGEQQRAGARARVRHSPSDAKRRSAYEIVVPPTPWSIVGAREYCQTSAALEELHHRTEAMARSSMAAA